VQKGCSRNVSERGNSANSFQSKSVETDRNETALRLIMYREQSNHPHLADGLATRLNNPPGVAATAALVV
jgi:hypothetical protein